MAVGRLAALLIPAVALVTCLAPTAAQAKDGNVSGNVSGSGSNGDNNGDKRFNSGAEHFTWSRLTYTGFRSETWQATVRCPTDFPHYTQVFNYMNIIGKSKPKKHAPEVA